MSVTAGVDIGSTASKAVVVVDGAPAAEIVGPSSTNPARTARRIYDAALRQAGVAEGDVAFVVGTGYGRTQVPFATKNVSEITCHGRGAHFLRPETRTVIDIGGQDTKVIRIEDDGSAAGTGRFLEAMARSMELPLADMERHYFGDGDACTITSLCSVFAESEVINLINDGVPLPGIVKGLLHSLSARVSALVRRVGVEPALVMTGGVAKSDAVRQAVQQRLDAEILGFDGADPQIVGALGAALIAADFAGAA